MMDPAELRPYENNPRNNDSAVDAVADSIREFGFRSPIIADRNRVIIAGHTRLMAALQLGLREVPVIIAEDMTEEQARAYRLADNRTGELASWIETALAEELEAIEGIDMSQFGFDVPEGPVGGIPGGLLGAGLGGASGGGAFPAAGGDDPGDEAPGVEETEPTVKRGQIWRLGDHVLMCGDSALPEDLAALMNAGGGEMSDMAFTDPPYGVAIGSKNRMLSEAAGGGGGVITEDIIGDTLPEDELRAMLTRAFANLRESSKEDASYYVTSPQGGGLGLMMLEMMRDAGLAVRHILVWVKNVSTFSMGRLDYDYQHEPIMYTWTKRHRFYGDGGIRTTAWFFDKPHRNDLHPTMKPVALVRAAVLNSTKEGDIVTDIFGGSGTTLIACEQTGRRCRMMEMDPRYCDVIIARWESLTGRKAELAAEAGGDAA